MNNPFDSPSSQEEQEELNNGNYLQTSKPYEQRFQKFNELYNSFMERMMNFQQRTYISNTEKDLMLINLNMINFEYNIGIFDIIKTDSKNFDKICASFVFLDVEVNKTIELFEQRLYDVISMYGQRPSDEDDDEVILREGQAEIQFSRILGVLKQIYDILKKMIDYLLNITAQLAVIYRKESPYLKGGFKNVDLFTPIQTIGKIISVVYTLDIIVNENENLKNHWNFYKKMIVIIKKEPGKYGIDAKQAKAFEKSLNRLDKTVLSGQCLQGIFMQNYDPFKDPKKDVPAS